MEVLRVKYGALTGWTVPKPQMAIITDTTVFPAVRQSVLFASNRTKLWVKGSINDIRQGEYISGYTTLDPRTPPGPDVFDNVTEETVKGGFVVQRGWARGLENNVAMEINGKPVLVMDNHYFAAGFIIEMARLEILRYKSKMIHIDEHHDMARGNYFDMVAYNNFRTESEKISYLLSNANVAAWIEKPLVLNGLIDPLGYLWFVLDKENLLWSVGMPRSTSPEHRMGTFEDLETISMVYEDPIVDIDIDVLLPIEEKLTSIEKENIRKGVLPKIIEQKLFDMAQTAKKGKVITIATSPAYINQERGIIYIKRLLELIAS